MTTFAVGDLAPAPLTSMDPRGNEVVVTRAATWKWMERTSRKVCTEFGSVAVDLQGAAPRRRSQALGHSRAPPARRSGSARR